MSHLSRIIEILSDFTEADPSDIQADSTILQDLNLSSLDILDAINAFEDEFDISISDEQIKSIQTVGDIDQLIQSALD